MLTHIKVIFFDLGQTLVDTATKSWIPGADELINKLGEINGLRLGVISNTGDLTRDELKNLLPQNFDWNIFEPGLVLLSSETGIEKPSLTNPNLEIFERAVSAANVMAAECFYCSEDLFETIAAGKAGLTTARLSTPPNSDIHRLENILRSLGLLN